MRRVLACLAAASGLILAAPVPDASASGRGSSQYGRAGLGHRPAVRQAGFNRLAFRRDTLGRGRFGYGSRYGYGYGGYGYGSGRGDVQQNVFVGEDDSDEQRFDRFPITATTGIAPSPTPEPVIYVIHAARPERSLRSVERPGAKVVRLRAGDASGERPETGTRVVAVTVPPGR